MIYFIYQSRKFNGLGGLMPPTVDLPETVQLGLANQDDFYLGQAESEYDLLPIKDFIVQYIDEETALGFRILNLTEIREGGEEPEEEESSRPLTDSEKEAQNKAYNLLLKLKMREKIKSNVGDIEDLLADQSKRIDMLERLVMRVLYYLLNDEEMPDDVKERDKAYVNYYWELINSGKAITRIDIEPIEEVFNRVQERIPVLNKIVKEEYLDKKR